MDLCAFCQKSLAPDDSVKLSAKGALSINRISESRSDNIEASKIITFNFKIKIKTHST